MKVAALGDAHLGRSYLPVVNEQGVNQREVDFEHAFEAAVALALAQEPDVVVWLGDVFDHPRPTYRSYRVAQRALRTISEHGIPTVVISGNHDTPRLPGTGSPYSTLADSFEGRGVHFAARMAYERFDLPGLAVHAVPQMMTVEATLEALEHADRNRSNDRTNLLLTHPRVRSVQPAYADINEIEVDDAMLRSDLVLLGHYHFHVKVTRNTWYAGSTDTFTFADTPEKPKGIVVLDTETGDCCHVPVPGLRPLVTLESVEALGRSPAEVQDEITSRVSTVEEGAVARLYIEGVDPEAYRLLDLDAVREAGSAALHLKLEPRFASVDSRVDLPELDALPAQWDRYLSEQDLLGLDRDRVAALGHDYLDRAVEEAVE